MTDLGTPTSFLGVQIETGDDYVKIHQTRYIEELLKRFGMSDAAGVSTPMVPNSKLSKSNGDEEFPLEKDGIIAYQSVVGSLMYAMLFIMHYDICVKHQLLESSTGEPKTANYMLSVIAILLQIQLTENRPLALSQSIMVVPPHGEASSRMWLRSQQLKRNISAYQMPAESSIGWYRLLKIVECSSQQRATSLPFMEIIKAPSRWRQIQYTTIDPSILMSNFIIMSETKWKMGGSSSSTFRRQK